MALNVRLVALRGLSERSSWDPKRGVRHAAITGEHVLVRTFTGMPLDGELRDAVLQDIRNAGAEVDGYAELRSASVLARARTRGVPSTT